MGCSPRRSGPNAEPGSTRPGRSPPVTTRLADADNVEDFGLRLDELASNCSRNPGRLMQTDLVATGTVKFYKAEKGWGAISCPELPDGSDAWVHFSAIEGVGYKTLEPGEVVEFKYESARQDSFRFTATRVRRSQSP